MIIQIFDIGNSMSRGFIYDVGVDSVSLIRCDRWTTKTDFESNLVNVQQSLGKNVDAIMFITSSDNFVVWGNEAMKWVKAQDDGDADIPPRPLFRETGKTEAHDWQGIHDKLFQITGNPQKVLPVSAAYAARIVEDTSFRSWDITHASNSGVFSYQLPSVDARFPNSGWHPCVDRFIESDWFDRKILPCDHIVGTYNGAKVLLGGHDTTFAVANQIPYSTKPYISCGTWTTVSVESSVRPNWEDKGQRYLIAPNGAILKQLCFPSEKDDPEVPYKVADYINKNVLPSGTKTDIQGKYIGNSTRISLFGSWRHALHQKIVPLLPGRNICIETEDYLTQQAASYVARSIS